MVKIICAGYPKTGTKSLTEALRILGCGNIHDYLEHVEFHMDNFQKVIFENQSLDAAIDNYEKLKVDCTVDMPPSFFFEEFFKRWPKAKVILTIRDEEAWYKSVKKMNQGASKSYYWMTFLSNKAMKYESYQRKIFQYMLGSPLENSWLWKMHYRRHTAYVQHVIPADQLLIFNVADGWEPLCKFLRKEIPNEPFPFVNASGSKGNIIERLVYETNLAKEAKQQIACSIIFIVLLTVMIAYVCTNYLNHN